MAEVRTKAVPAPTLLSLCLKSVAAHLTADAAGAGRSGGCPDHFDGFALEHEEEDGHLTPELVAEALPWEILHQLASSLPPLALESLHHAAHARYPTLLLSSPLPALTSSSHGPRMYTDNLHLLCRVTSDKQTRNLTWITSSQHPQRDVTMHHISCQF
jgi:hypothetical protein